MAIYIVSYDLHASAYEDELLKYLKGFNWAKASSSSYCIVTNKTASQVVDDVKAITNNQITVYVFTITGPWSGFGPKEVNDWLAKNLS